MFEASNEPPELEPHVKALLAVWSVLLLPWLLFAPLAGMAFDGGPTWNAYVFVWSTLTYPVSLGVAFVLRRRVPLLSLLPVLNLAGFFISGL